MVRNQSNTHSEMSMNGVEFATRGKNNTYRVCVLTMGILFSNPTP
jgi:hypothetical protein